MKKYIVILILSFSSAHAGLFQGDSSGIFVNPTGPLGMVTTGVGTNSFTWGNGRSSLFYEGVGFDVNENDIFVFGSLSFFNATSTLGTQADSVDLSVELSFMTPSGFSESFLYDLGLINTTNIGDPFASADIVNFDNTVPSNFFSIGGADFTLEFLGFGQLTGGGFTVADSFRAFEGNGATVELAGRITSSPGSPVPEPTTLWLCGLGLVGLIGARKSKNILKGSA